VLTGLNSAQGNAFRGAAIQIAKLNCVHMNTLGGAQIAMLSALFQ
jgi:hypothetical protein